MKTTKFYPFVDQPWADTCWSLSTGPDGRVYAAACCEHKPGGGVQVVRYDDATDSLRTVFDVAEVTGQPLTSGQATQCKVHYSFAPSVRDGILYAATHLSAPGFGRAGYSPWADWKDEQRAFPFSTLVAYDTQSDRVAWTSPFIPREGCRCLALDEGRGKLYTISYPRDHFWIFDIPTRTIRDLGRLGSVNSQVIFTDHHGRVFTSNDRGQFVRYDTDTDRLEEIPVFVPHEAELSGWHNVFYDVVSSPEGDCVYGVPWNANPHLFRYWPEDGPNGRIEDLGPVHQDRDRTQPVSFYLDHCGGLVFGADGMLYYATVRWTPGDEYELRLDRHTEGILVQLNPRTLERRDFARIEIGRPIGQYVCRGARDRFGNLFFGLVKLHPPEGIARLDMDAGGNGKDLHLPIRTWG